MKKLILLPIAFVLLMSTIFGAELLVEQVIGGTSANTPLHFDTNYRYVSFNVTPQSTFNLSILSITVRRFSSPTGVLWIEIYNGSTFPTVGTNMLANSSTFNVSNTSNAANGDYINVTYAAPLLMYANQSYVFVLGSNMSFSTTNNIRPVDHANTSRNILKSSNGATWTVDAADFQTNYQFWSNETPPAPSFNYNWTVNLTDAYSGEQIGNFSAIINNTFYRSVNGIINALLNSTTNYNITFFNATLANLTNFNNNSLAGSSVQNLANAIDGNFSTLSYTIAGPSINTNLYWNYTVPLNATAVTWMVKDGGSLRMLNNTESTCPITYPYQLRFNANPTGRSRWQCWDGSAWTTLSTWISGDDDNGSTIYEQELTYGGQYFTRVAENVNITSNATFTIASSNITFNVSDRVTGAPITTANFTTVVLTNTTHYMTARPYVVNASALGYYNNSFVYNATPLSITTYTAPALYNLIANITARNFYTNTTILNYTVHLTNEQFNFTEDRTSNTGTGLTQFNLSRSYLYNISLLSNESGGYFNITYFNVNLTSSNFTAYMAQSNYTFYGVEKVTGANLTGVNFSTLYLTNVTHYMAAGTYALTAFKTGYLNKTISFTASALNISTQNLSYIGNTTLNITAYNILYGSNLTTFNVVLSNSTYNYSESFAITNGILLDNTTTVTLFYNVTATGFFPATGNVTLTGVGTNLSIGLLPIGGINITFINGSNGAVIPTNTGTVQFQNSTTSTSFTATNGVAVAANLSTDTYSVLCQLSGFDNTSFFFDYTLDLTTTPTGLFCFMYQGTTQITIAAQSPDGNALDGVLVQIQQFVNGTFQDVASDVTDGTGQTVINLVQGVTTRITLSVDGYLTQTNTNNLDLTTYTYTMSPVSRFDPSNSAGSDVQYSFTPTQLDLNLSVWNFSLTVDPTFSNIDFFRITLYTQNGTLISTINSTNASGGTISILLNTTPYNGTSIRSRLAFQKTNNTLFETPIYYNVRDVPYTGSVTQAREYITATFTLGERIFLWMFCSIVAMILLYAFGIRDLANMLVGSAAWAGLAYLFGMNMVLIGFFEFIIVVVLVRYSS